MIWTAIALKLPLSTPSFPRKRESRGLRMPLTGGSRCSIFFLLSNVNITYWAISLAMPILYSIYVAMSNLRLLKSAAMDNCMMREHMRLAAEG